MQITLIRHGSTAGNLEHRYVGRTDEPLTDHAIAVLRETEMKYPRAEVLFVSPMKRCLETAELLYPEKEPVVMEEWREMNFGAFEGKNYLDLKDDERYQAWIDSNGTIAFPQGESREEFVRRTVKGMDKLRMNVGQIIEDGRAVPKGIGIIAHGGTIMALLSHYDGGEYFDYQVGNGAGYQCKLMLSPEGMKIADIKKI